jgi:hypothetical protein
MVKLFACYDVRPSVRDGWNVNEVLPTYGTTPAVSR